MHLRAAAVLACAALCAPALAQRASKPAAPPAPYYPGLHDWERKAPEAVGMDPALVKQAIDFAIAGASKAPRDLALNHAQTQVGEPYNDPVGPFKERGPQGGVIVRHGYLVAEWGEPQRVDMTFSVTKSFVSTVVGLAYDRGLIRDLSEQVKDYVPTEHFASAHNSKIRWDDLLRQTSDWEGTLWGKPDWADRPDRDKSTWLTRTRNEPGSVYEYNDVRVNLTAFAALQVWRRPLPQVLRELVMDPIGASNTWRWHGYENSWVELDGQRIQSVSGGGHWGGGMWISARDQARFGLLTLRRGRWKDKQVLSEKWIQMATTPTPANTGYGFMNYFLNTAKPVQNGKPADQMLPSAPASAWMHRGAGENLVYCDPENDLVVVTRWVGPGTMDGVVKRLLEAVARKSNAPSASGND
jgi:CubicO group peptidase (beta-lactamase class C family)